MALSPRTAAQAAVGSSDGGRRAWPIGRGPATTRAEAQYRRIERQSYTEMGMLLVLVAVVRVVAWQNADDGQSLLLYVWPVALLVAGYFGLSVPAVRVEHRLRGYLFIALLPVIGIALGAVHLDFAVAMVVMVSAFEAFWMFDKKVHALATVIAVAGVTAGGLFLLHEAGSDDLQRILLNIGLNAAIGIAIALWVVGDMKSNLANAHLVDELEAAQAELSAVKHAEGVKAERERMAQEIHDTLAQGFTTILMQAQAADRALAKGDLDKVRERQAVVRDVARDNLAEARALVAAFAPAPLLEASLPDALRRLASRWSAETGVPVDVRLDDVGPMAPEDDVVLLRAAQEALANVARHAGASRVSLRLGGRPGFAVRLAVADDGRGIGDAADGYGLRGMRARVAEVGGTVSVTPGDPGTIVRITLPPRPEPGPEEEARP